MSSPTEPTRHYFSVDPDTPSEERCVEVLLSDLAFTIRTDSGVFSHGKVDAGTLLLLAQETKLPSAGNILDLGCGAGVIAVTLAQRAPGSQIWAVDVNSRARDLCTKNAAALGLNNLVVRAPEDVPADVRFDAIWSNPPIRIGKDALHDLLDQWVWRLTPQGELWMVVSKHLGSDSLQQWLTVRGAPTERITSKAGYRILRSVVDSDAWRINRDAQSAR
jgi:16S rRNA (guanine1207-N2)-methyltransferase